MELTRGLSVSVGKKASAKRRMVADSDDYKTLGRKEIGPIRQRKSKLGGWSSSSTTQPSQMEQNTGNTLSIARMPKKKKTDIEYDNDSDTTDDNRTAATEATFIKGKTDPNQREIVTEVQRVPPVVRPEDRMVQPVTESTTFDDLIFPLIANKYKDNGFDDMSIVDSFVQRYEQQSGFKLTIIRSRKEFRHRQYKCVKHNNCTFGFTVSGRKHEKNIHF